jgi:hypothetical protein
LNRKALIVIVFVGLLVVSCGGDPEPVYEVGEHRLMLAVPEGWEFAARGAARVLSLDGWSIVMRDVGVVDEKSVEKGALAARELWREGRYEDATARLEEVDLERAVATDDQRKRLAEIWPQVAGGNAEAKPKDVEKAYDRLLRLIDDLPEVDLAELLDGMLWDLGEGRDRGVASQTYREVNGRRVLVVDTWTRLGHAAPQRFAFLQEDGRGLVVFTEKGDPVEMEEGFDTLLESIRFAPGPESD